MGAVGSLRNIRHAARVANAVRLYTKHSLLVADDAHKFAREMGFEAQATETPESLAQFQQWLDAKCQPNYRMVCM